MNIAVLGNGAREDAISEKLISENNKVFLINNNNIRKNNVDIDINDFEKIKSFCLDNKVELIIVGPENLLANGIVDYFQNTNIKVFGPNKYASLLESSKVFAKEFMKRNNVATADYISFDKFDELEIKKVINEKNGVLALKYDGLAAGKGVFVSDNIEDAYKNLEIIKDKYLSDNFKLIIEDSLVGREISIMSFTDSNVIKIFQASQDYKLSGNNNTGFNTGGMGAITPLDFVTTEVLSEINNKIINPTLEGLKKDKINYNGFLYFGIILTKRGPYLLEYNVRMGDPETQVLLPALKTNFTNLIIKTLNNKLSDIESLKFSEDYYLSLVLANDGYPLNYSNGEKIVIDENLVNCNIYYAGVKRNNNGELLTNGGRILNIVNSNKDINKLKNSVYLCAKHIKFKTKYFRDDIGKVY